MRETKLLTCTEHEIPLHGSCIRSYHCKKPERFFRWHMKNSSRFPECKVILQRFRNITTDSIIIIAAPSTAIIINFMIPRQINVLMKMMTVIIKTISLTHVILFRITTIQVLSDVGALLGKMVTMDGRFVTCAMIRKFFFLLNTNSANHM